MFYVIYYKKNIESFQTNDGLYPIKGLQPICAQEELLPSYMPTSCFVDGELDPYANCKCEDKYGNCKICYPKLTEYQKSQNAVIYKGDDLS